MNEQVIGLDTDVAVSETERKKILLSRVMTDEQQVVMSERRDAFAQVFGDGYMQKFTDPILFVDAQFSNYRIRKFYEVNFSFMSRNLFAEYVYRRRAKYNRELLTKFSELMARKLDGAKKVLDKFSGQVSHVLEMDSSDATAIGYMQPTYHMVPVIHAQARQYLELLQTADKLFTNVAAATITGLITSEEKTKIEHKSILALRALGNTIRSENIILRKEANRLRTEQKAAGLDEDHELETAIDMQNSAIADAGKVERSNELLDGIAFTKNEEIEAEAIKG